MKRFVFALIAISLISIDSILAQNPFEKLGVEVGVITLSKGKYIEFIPYDSLQHIGSVVINIKTGYIVELINTDSVELGYNYRPDVASRWMSPDPLTEEFTSWSPYNYGNDNPIFFVDPSGGIIEPWFEKTNSGYQKNDKFNNTSLFKTVSKNFISLYAKNDIFKKVVNQLSNSEQTYIVKQDQHNGSTFDNPIVGTYCESTNTIGFAIWDMDEPQKSTVFEEFFHAGQEDFYGQNNTKTDLQTETEAKIAQAFTGGSDEFGVKENLGFYFDAIKSGNVTKEIQSKAEDVIKGKIAPKVAELYKDYWNNHNMKGNEIEKYKVSIDYFKSLINK